MSIFTKTWNFNTNSDGFTLTNCSWDSDGSILVNAYGRNITVNATASITSDYGTIGVPTNVMINRVHLEIDHRCSDYYVSDYANLYASINSGSAINQINYSGITSYATAIGSDIELGSISTSSQFTINIFMNVDNANDKSASTSVKFDNVKLVVEYTEPIYNIDGSITESIGDITTIISSKQSIGLFLNYIGDLNYSSYIKSNVDDIISSIGDVSSIISNTGRVLVVNNNVGDLYIINNLKCVINTIEYSTGAIYFINYICTKPEIFYGVALESVGLNEILCGNKSSRSPPVYSINGYISNILTYKTNMFDIVESIGVNFFVNTFKNSNYIITHNIGDNFNVEYIIELYKNDKTGTILSVIGDNHDLNSFKHINDFILSNNGVITYFEIQKQSYCEILNTIGVNFSIIYNTILPFKFDKKFIFTSKINYFKCNNYKKEKSFIKTSFKNKIYITTKEIKK